MKKALVFGGAFNPPTNAHIELAHKVMTDLGYDCVIYVPSKSTYIEFEQGKDFVFTEAERLDMLQRIAEDKEWMIVSDYELNLAEQPRTYKTLCHLRDEGYDCTLLFGSDKLPELEFGWRYVDEICAQFGIVCMARNEDNVRELIREDPYLKAHQDFITIAEVIPEYRALSSTRVREQYMAVLDALAALKEMVPAELDGLKEWLRGSEE